ncbi:alpha/beta hydrolase [Phenylobacterium sp. Root77]|uniref:alpha/beta hydrolase n=1 Tax=unclassified Phenylobacterium TaxID=2640670 RepID=UPI0006FE3595|nr:MULTISPECIES: alpha/beta fold hydrolase [unclassified Phenylobacterium]KQW73014.1 alpha/beta hydrolase [Phenylobacterium sp. Root1277]KQW92233.1 alpha/beta hydrolase [Phenylobacterium sp. Root1290]KRC40464.1 alpha/beta hydrolase [Phenylobacterium sp. Root77]
MAVVREAYGFVHADKSRLKEVYGGPTGQVFVECMRVRPDVGDSKTVILFSHPVGGGSFLPLVSALARAGRHVVYCNPRYRGNDTALIMEKCVLDLGACIADLKTRFGYEKVVLGGWSGGGSLSLFYQDQAQTPTITHTPAGDEVDIAGAGLQAADGVMLLAAHISRSVTMTEWLDPSILDESRPFERDPGLNIYDPKCPETPPYSEAFVQRFREAQIARNRRITAWAKAQLAELKAAGDPDAERCFVVQGTMSDVRWTDPTQDPSDRRPHTCYLGDPKIVNDGPVGLGRFTTLRSWLSQWSYDESRANGVVNAGRISCPVLVINNTADLACTPSHAQRLFDAVASADKTLVHIEGADHYYAERPDLLPRATAAIGEWLDARGF